MSIIAHKPTRPEEPMTAIDGRALARVRRLPAGSAWWRRARDFGVGHPVLAVFTIALVARLALAIAVNTFADGALFQDDSTYPVLAAQKASGDTATWGDYEYFLYDATATFLVPLTWLYRLFGPAIFLGQVLVAAFAAVAAAATTRLGLEGLGVRPALGAGLVVALLPSQILFSSIVLKDASVWACLAVLGLLVAGAGRLAGVQLFLTLLAVGVLYLLLAHLRLHTLVAAGWAATLAVWLVPGPGRLQRGGGVLALTLIVPLFLGLGVGGIDLVRDASGTLDERRRNNAVGAATAFVPSAQPSPAAAAVVKSAVPGRPSKSAAAIPDPLPSPSTEPVTLSEDGVTAISVRALPRGLSVMVLEPYPVPASVQNSRVLLALLENLLWWPLLALAAWGLRDAWELRRVLGFPILVGGAIVFLYALSEGNFGTAYRHRGEVVWIVGLLAACGLRRIGRYRGSRTEAV